jgi:translation initiation factor 6
MSLRVQFENSSEIAAFARVTNAYTLVASSTSTNFLSVFESELSQHQPVVQVTIGGTSIIGRLCVGNKHGLLVPSITTDTELQHIRNGLPESVVVRRIDDRLSALGNCIATNDYTALIHPDMDAETEELISDTLKCEVFRSSIAGNVLVGSYSMMNNSGCLVHPKTSATDLEELAQLLQIPVAAGTVNRGSDVVGSGICVNDFAGFVGMATTSTEISVIDKVFKLSVPGSVVKRF